MGTTERVKQFIDFKGVSKYKFCKELSFSNKFLDNSSNMGTDKASKILHHYPEINPEWLLTGEGSMLKDQTIDTKQKNMIPLYEDVGTIGGASIVANTDAVSETKLQIDAGGWFNGATAAIRHYGDSMNEYQSGCILAIKELHDKNEIIWGRNYVVETDEMRITKKIAEIDQDHINCYSTNNETYPDGALIHQPIKVCKKNIRRISKVLGAVNKEESTGQVTLL